jgi:hypothetical protein
MTRRVILLAVAVAAVAVAIAIALPMYTCMEPYEYEFIPGPGAGDTCIISDMGYQPRSWLPTKITIGAAGIVAAFAIVLWSRRRRTQAIGLVVAFVAVAIAWFVLDA